MLGILRAIQGPTKVKPDCISSQLYEEDGDDGAVLYLEEWESDREFNKHVRSELYRRLLEAVELSRRQPEIRFIRVSHTRGIDLLEEMRTGT